MEHYYTVGYFVGESPNRHVASIYDLMIASTRNQLNEQVPRSTVLQLVPVSTSTVSLTKLYIFSCSDFGHNSLTNFGTGSYAVVQLALSSSPWKSKRWIRAPHALSEKSKWNGNVQFNFFGLRTNANYRDEGKDKVRPTVRWLQ